MNIQPGDTVMHWTHGLGQVLRMEMRILSDKNTMYYMIQVDKMTIWVPADGDLETRLRAPASKAEFKQLFAILSGLGDPLPEDRYERKTRLLAQLKDGRAESRCRVIRDITAYKRIGSVNETDLAILKRSQKLLIDEWSYVLGILPMQAERELDNLLEKGSTGG